MIHIMAVFPERGVNQSFVANTHAINDAAEHWEDELAFIIPAETKCFWAI